jgi:hypothetical protein
LTISVKFHFISTLTVENSKMKRLTLILWLCLSASPVLADPGGVPNGGVGNGNGNENHMGAPAPLLGFGIPSALAVGGVLLGAKLFGRRRR